MGSELKFNPVSEKKLNKKIIHVPSNQEVLNKPDSRVIQYRQLPLLLPGSQRRAPSSGPCPAAGAPRSSFTLQKGANSPRAACATAAGPKAASRSPALPQTLLEHPGHLPVPSLWFPFPILAAPRFGGTRRRCWGASSGGQTPAVMHTRAEPIFLLPDLSGPGCLNS